MSGSRVLTLHQSDNESGDSIVYVMSRDQRVNDNHALLEAAKAADNASVPLIVLFVLYSRSGVRSQEQYRFMLDGLREVKKALHEKNIAFILRSGRDNPVKVINEFLNEMDARSVYFDFSPLRGSRMLEKKVAKKFKGSSYVVDAHNIIPVWVVSDKQEYAAHTLRRKVHKQLESWLEKPATLTKHPHSLSKTLHSTSFSEAESEIKHIDKSNIQLSVAPGETAAQDALKSFIGSQLKSYANGRNDIATDQQSGLSPYLHFGQLSSLRVALEVMNAVDEPPLLLKQAKMPEAKKTDNKPDGMNALLEELIVRKELSDNFCFYNNAYDSVDGAPDWAKKELKKHSTDNREYTYTKKQFEDARTHDDLWNAAQNQLRQVGNIHGYMRMYWAKKIFEWSEKPETAIKTAIYLNDHYSIDGGDPNGYVGILWSMTGLHDRPWFERSVYGKIRYMTASGIEKKFDTSKYIKDWK